MCFCEGSLLNFILENCTWSLGRFLKILLKTGAACRISKGIEDIWNKSKENYSLTFLAVCTALPATACQADNLITIRNLSPSLSLNSVSRTAQQVDMPSEGVRSKYVRAYSYLHWICPSHQQVWSLVWERFKLPQLLRAKAQKTHLSSSAHLFLPDTLLLHVYLLLSLKRL